MHGVIRKVMGAVALTAALSTVGVAVGATPAAAAPTSCHIGKRWTEPGMVWYRCDGGTGYYRAMAYCSRTPGGWGTYIIGPWRGVSSGLPSYAYCTSDQPYLVDGWGERR